MNTKKCPRCGGSGKILDDKTVGAELRSKREAAGVSLRNVAKKAGLSVSYLSDLERGHRIWTAQKLQRYERALEEVRE